MGEEIPPFSFPHSFLLDPTKRYVEKSHKNGGCWLLKTVAEMEKKMENAYDFWDNDLRVFVPYEFDGTVGNLEREIKAFHPMWQYRVVSVDDDTLVVMFLPNF